MSYIAVCVKFLNRFIESLDESTKSTPAKIEDAFRKFCKTAKGDDNRFVSFIFTYTFEHSQTSWTTSSVHLLYYYTAIVCPVYEYCCGIWHHNIPNKLPLQIENIQKWATKIIFEVTRCMPYSGALNCADLPSLQHRQDQQARKFLKLIFELDSCLHCLLPARVIKIS